MDMMGPKTSVHLTTEQETLLITLYAKAVGCPDNVFKDPSARDLLHRMDYDFSQLMIPLSTRLMLCMRAKQFDAYVRRFMVEHPQGVVLHLGCGLDTRFQRLDNRQVIWYDLDVPEVISLRRRFFKTAGRYHMLSSSVTDLAWMTEVHADSQLILIVAEGLMMYLPQEQVRTLILALQSCFPGSQLIFDAISTLTSKWLKAHPSIKKTGAVVRWGIDDVEEIEGWGTGIELDEEWCFTQSDAITNLGLGSRLMFKVVGSFSIARKAHRILVFSLA